MQVANVTGDKAVIGLMGPQALQVLPDLADMPWLTTRETTVAGDSGSCASAVLYRRTRLGAACRRR